MPGATWTGLIAAAPVDADRRQRLLATDVGSLDQLARELNEHRGRTARATDRDDADHHADDRLGENETTIEPGLDGQEAVPVGPQQLDNLELCAAVPRQAGGEQRAPVGQIHRGEHAAEVVVEQAGELDTQGNLGAAAEQVGDHVEQTPRADGCSPNSTTSGKSKACGNPMV